VSYRRNYSEQGGLLNIAVIGSGISGLSAAWLLSKGHKVTLFESDTRLGGHSNTVDVGSHPVDTGFIVYNEATYPNLSALFAHLDVPTKPSEMTFAVSLDDGRLEYSGTGLSGLFAQRRNLCSPRFWGMLRDLVRFYNQAPGDVAKLPLISLDDYLGIAGYGSAFRDDHLYPMAAAIWSIPAAKVGDYPAEAFVRFCANHGLLKLTNRPVWRTVDGGSRVYVERLTRSFADRIVMGQPVRRIKRVPDGVDITHGSGAVVHFDHVMIATHADQALRMLSDPSPSEQELLGAFRYSQNEAVLHTDASLMPKLRNVWSSWNYMSSGPASGKQLSVTYWMNRLQDHLPESNPVFVTLNPIKEPKASMVLRREVYEHPIFDVPAIAAQDRLWTLQGARNTWYCGAYFGAGFHEDGLQAGLAAAEALGGVRRPWTVMGESNRIRLLPLEKSPFPQVPAS
jgi:predicted NAD/FAD-binding protein